MRLSSFALCASLALASFGALAAPMTQDSSGPIPDSLLKPLPGLARAIAGGAETACAPTHLSVSGPAQNGVRFFASALVKDFPATVRQTAKGTYKLTPAQGKALQRLVDQALASQRSGTGFSKELVEHVSAETGLQVEATMICLSSTSWR